MADFNSPSQRASGGILHNPGSERNGMHDASRHKRVAFEDVAPYVDEGEAQSESEEEEASESGSEYSTDDEGYGKWVGSSEQAEMGGEEEAERIQKLFKEELEDSERVLSQEQNIEKQTKWASLLNKENPILEEADIESLVFAGIPPSLRGRVWKELAAAIPINNSTALFELNYDSEEFEQAYQDLLRESSGHEEQIKKDVARTFPEEEYFQRKGVGFGQEALYNVMKAYSVWDEEVGYCQGQAFIVGVLLMHMPEHEAFWVLLRLMYGYLREIFKPDMECLQLLLYQLNSLLGDMNPKLLAHFEEEGLTMTMVSSPWFLTIFAYQLPLQYVFRVLDICLLEGVHAIFRIGLTLFSQYDDLLMKMELEQIMEFFRYQLRNKISKNPDQIVLSSQKVNIHENRLHELEEEFCRMQHPEGMIQTRIERITNNSEELSEILYQKSLLEEKVRQMTFENDSLKRKVHIMNSNSMSKEDDVEVNKEKSIEVQIRLTTELAEALNTCRDLEHDKSELRKQLASEKQRTNQLSSELEKYKTECARKSKDMVLLIKKLKSTEKQSKVYRSQLEECSMLLNEIQQHVVD
eukprot:Nk52_evm9s252 gene=Nk52_evmTU9s252